MPDWLDNFCALNQLYTTWNASSRQWTVLKGAGSPGSFWITVIPERMKFEEFQGRLTKDPPP